MTRLNLGAGGQIAEGWQNIDRAFTDDTVARWQGFPDDATLLEHDLAEPLPFGDGTASMAVAHHVLDLMDDVDIKHLCAEVFRVLEPSGVWRISSVDYRHAIGALVKQDFDWFDHLGVPQDNWSIGDTFAWYLSWGGARRTIFYDPMQLVIEYLRPAGFACDLLTFHETLTVPSICELDSREEESWFMEARKP